MNIKESTKTYIHYSATGDTHFDPEKFKKVVNRKMCWFKPVAGTGLWASPVDSTWGWKDWCESEKYMECKEEESFKFKLKSGNRVLTLKVIGDEKGYPEARTTNVFYYPTLHDDDIYFDFERLRDEFHIDAIELEDVGPFYFPLYGWDCESILVLNPDVIKEVIF